MHSSVCVSILNCNPFKRRKSLSSNLLVNKIRNRKIWRRFLYVAQQVGSNRRCTGRPHDVELTWVYKCWEKTWENLPIYTKWFVLETHFIQQVFCPPWFREFPIDIYFFIFFFGSASWLKALTEIYLRSRWRFPSRNWIIVIHGGKLPSFHLPSTVLIDMHLLCFVFRKARWVFRQLVSHKPPRQLSRIFFRCCRKFRGLCRVWWSRCLRCWHCIYGIGPNPIPILRLKIS